MFSKQPAHKVKQMSALITATKCCLLAGCCTTCQEWCYLAADPNSGK